MKVTKQVTKTFRLFLVQIEMLRSQLLPTTLALLFKYMILLFLRLFSLIFIKNIDTIMCWIWERPQKFFELLALSQPFEY